MRNKTESQIRARREERKRIKKRNAERREAKKKLLKCLRYCAFFLAFVLLYIFAFTFYAPIKREEARMFSGSILSAELKQVVISARRGTKSHDYIDITTEDGVFYFHLSGNYYEKTETAEYFEKMEGRNVTIIATNRKPDTDSQLRHAGNTEAIEVIDGEKVFGSLEAYNKSLRENAIFISALPTAVVLFFAVLIFLALTIPVSKRKTKVIK